MRQQKVIDELLSCGLFGRDIELLPITGGEVNHSFRLRCDKQSYFVKLFELNQLVPCDRQKLFAQQQVLFALGKATQPVYLSKAQDFQVDSWLSHESLADSKLPKDQKVIKLASVLADIHRLPLVAQPLDLPSDWNRYLSVSCKSDSDVWLSRIQHCQQLWLTTRKHDQVLCHNDLSMSHVCVTQPDVVFDWEYSAIGNRYFDLVCCSIINELESNETLALQCHYAKLAELPESTVIKQCQTLYPVVHLTYDLWYAAANSTKQLKQ